MISFEVDRKWLEERLDVFERRFRDETGEDKARILVDFPDVKPEIVEVDGNTITVEVLNRDAGNFALYVSVEIDLETLRSILKHYLDKLNELKTIIKHALEK